VIGLIGESDSFVTESAPNGIGEFLFELLLGFLIELPLELWG